MDTVDNMSEAEHIAKASFIMWLLCGVLLKKGLGLAY
jgi:hypothetical protein